MMVPSQNMSGVALLKELVIIGGMHDQKDIHSAEIGAPISVLFGSSCSDNRVMC